ncbi:unnamed protein product [Trifolium pratense]|uniref:Uncharacterized protein n=1 Tax=Trifolium pratense TaxID=57577 RepID=A0ACB0IQC7_TRIPR|nr:unnamed protein product [Trifolium pratense]
MLGSTLAAVICNINSNQLKLCRGAFTVRNPPNQSNECYDVIRRANLTCVYSYKSILPPIWKHRPNVKAS